jgi:hypothetical protein
MGSFKNFLAEAEDYLAMINTILDQLDDEELDEFGYVLYTDFFDTEEEEEPSAEDNAEGETGEEDEADEPFTRADVDEMIQVLGPDLYLAVLELLDEDDGTEWAGEEDEDLEEGVTRRMIAKNMNRKKRKFMKNSKAMMRKTKAVRKRLARKTKAKRRRYYRANKVKIAAYQKSRASAIKKGKHKVKLRRAAG